MRRHPWWMIEFDRVMPLLMWPVIPAKHLPQRVDNLVTSEAHE